MKKTALDPDARAAVWIDTQTRVRQRRVAKRSKEYVRQDELNEVIVKLKRDAVGSLRLKGTEEVKNRAKEALKDKMDRHGTR